MAITGANVTGLNTWLWVRSGVLTTASTLKLPYGATGWDIPRQMTEIKTATLTTLGATGSQAGYKTHGTMKLTCLEDDGLSADYSAYWSKFDWLASFNARTNVPLAWGLAPATGVCAASTLLESGSFVVLGVSTSYKVDGQVAYDVTLAVDGDYSTYTTT
jgi:hypothetical protein